MNNEVSAEMATKNDDMCYHTDGLLFIQADINSLTDR